MIIPSTVDNYSALVLLAEIRFELIVLEIFKIFELHIADMGLSSLARNYSDILTDYII